MTTHIPLARALLPGVQVSTLTTQNFTINSAGTLFDYPVVITYLSYSPATSNGWATSSNGTTVWVRTTSTDINLAIRTGLYAQNKWVYVGSGTKSIYSTDGRSWTQSTMPANGDWNGFAYNGSVFCSVAYAVTTAATSTDAITWTARTLPSTANWYPLVWNGTVFITQVNNGTTAATSTNGVTWTSRTATSVSNIGSWTVKSGVSIFLGNGTNTGGRTTDGITWSSITLPATGTWFAAGADNTNFYAGRYSTNSLDYSTDGITWATRTLPVSANWANIHYSPTLGLRTIRDNVTSTSAKWCTSTDGTTWTQRTSTTYIGHIMAGG